MSDKDETHFMLKKSIDPSKYTHLFRLKPKLTATNYSTWTSMIIRALHTVGLHLYLNPHFHIPTSLTYETRHHHVRWSKANHFVCSILTACMTEEVQNQLGHLPTASEIWSEAQHLYVKTTTTDWTLTITSIVTTHYTDGKDIAAHIAKMKGYCRDLVLMQRDINDELFTCFLRISMPTSWNYVFAALPDQYSSAEVERHIRDEYGVCMSQSTSTSTAFQASHSNKTKDGHSCTPIPGQPYCTNYRILGHHTEDCYSKGGSMHGKRRDKKANKEDKGDTKQEDKSKKGKGKDKSKAKTSKKANQAVADEEEDNEDNRHSDSDLSAYLTGTSSRSRFGWILNGGSTNHICTERLAFTTFTPAHDSIKGIVKNGPELEVLGTGTVLVSVSSRMDRKGMEITK
ncbi:hypothetical protein SCLCIDRAFT_16854 [Scleroderma citrinum Foug A]|uniref:Retrovirus-related Pol polyprotein from transposon TNT 1-94-like beta-barrel domain-containing protein n=1 Tax=Scleroderma citrinum Foug A TaxID=1036808 RepID=A0A0C3DPT4_9AGAM|nr:hypothetical protein SCLCIDRAFT_16854 [Scleroderma citrinum Foug A]